MAKFVWRVDILVTNMLNVKILNSMQDYLSAQQQQIVLNGHMSSWEKVATGVPQRSVLG